MVIKNKPTEVFGYLNDVKSNFLHVFNGLTVSFLILVVALTVTFFAWQYNVNVLNLESQLKFDTNSRAATSEVQNEANRSFDLLNSVKGLFRSSHYVDRSEFEEFVNNLKIDNRYPYLLSLQYIQKVPAGTLSTFVNSVRSDVSLIPRGYPDFTVHKASKSSENDVVLYTEPFDSKDSFFGYNIRDNRELFDAFSSARDKGIPVSSKPTMIDGYSEKVFVVFVPLYKKNEIPKTINSRRDNFIGAVSGVFSSTQFFDSIFSGQNKPQDVDLEIYNSGDATSNSLLYTSDKTISVVANTASSYLRNSERVAFAGSVWVIEYGTFKDKIVGYTASRFPDIVAMGGLIGSLSLFGIVLSFATARRRALLLAETMTERLTESEEKYRSIFEALQDVYYRTDLTGAITIVSPSIEQYIGRKPEDLVGHNAKEFYLNPEARDKMIGVLMQEGVVNDYLIDLKGKDGAVINASLNALVFKDNNGKPVGVEGMLRDVSVRVKTEAVLAEKTKELETTKERITHEAHKLNAILSSMAESLIALDGNGRVVLMNQAAAILLRVAEGDAKGKNINTILPLFKDKEPIPDTASLIMEAIKTNGLTRMLMRDNVYTKDNDGRVFPIILSATSLMGYGEVEGVSAIVMFRDITEEKAIDQTKTEFVSLASHQLRTPLTAIGWYAEMLISGDTGKINKEQKSYLEQIAESNSRMVELVNSLLSVSRIDLGTFAINPEPTDLKEVSKSVIAELAPTIKKKKMKITEVYDPKVPVVSVDPKLIRIVFQNLLSNSVKYTQDKGAIEVGIKNKKTDILITVSDNGYGIPKAQQQKIFTKLFRADNVREKDTDGTGLGMYIVKSVVEQSGGEIWFESEENKGTTFFVKIPRQGMKKKPGSHTLNDAVT